MSAPRDQSVTTCRLGDAAGDAGHVVLIVDVDPAGLDLAGRRLLARVRAAVAAWEVAEAAGAGPAAAYETHAVLTGDGFEGVSGGAASRTKSHLRPASRDRK